MNPVLIILESLSLTLLSVDIFLTIRRNKKAYIKLCDRLCGKDCLFREENPLQTGQFGPSVKDCKNCPLARLK